MTKSFDYLAVATTAQGQQFAIAGSIDVETGQNPYMAVRHRLMADGFYAKIDSVKRENYSRNPVAI